MLELLLILALAMQADAGGRGPSGPGAPASAGREDVEITILHTAGFLSAFDKAPILYRIVQEERRGGRPVFLVDTGNHMDPAVLETTLSEGEMNIAVMNQIGYDAMAIGMGELRYGRDRTGREAISRRIEQANFPLISANLYSRNAGGEKGLLAFPSWAYPRDIEGIRIAFVGVTSLEGGTSHEQKRIRERFQAGPEVAAVDRQVRMLRNKVDLVVILSNCGNQVDFALVSSLEVGLLIGVSSVDFEEPLEIDGSRMVRTPQGGSHLGKIVLRVDGDSGKVTDLKYEAISIEGEGDEQLARKIVESREGYRGGYDKKVGVVKAAFTPSQSAILIADLVRVAARAEVAFCDTSEIVRPLPEGVVTMMDLWALMPRKRHLVKFKVPGKRIRGFIERDLKQGRRYRLSGVNYVYDPTLPEGGQLVSVTVGKEPLRGDREYVCVADGGTVGSTGFFPEALEGTPTGEIVHYVLEEHFSAARGSVAAPGDGRVVRRIPGVSEVLE